MIDVMFVPYAAHGHVNPLLPVLRELHARGCRVRVLVGPAFAEVVAATGAEVVAVPVGFETWVPERFRWAELRRLGRSARTRLRADSAGKALLRQEIERRRPDVVVWDAMSGWAGRLARAAGVPAMVWSTTYAVNDAVLAGTARHRYGDLAATLARRARLARLAPAARGADPVLVTTLPELQPARASFPSRFHFVGPLLGEADRGGEPLPWAEIEARPVLLVSPGTVFARGPGFFQAAAEAFADTDWLVLLATGATDPAELGWLPDNVIARRRLPQRAVLAHTSVFVTHAGMNSVLESLAAGVPMVVAPRLGDQRGTARRLTGLGLAVPVAQPVRAAALYRAVRRVAGDERMRARAAELGARIAVAGAAGRVAGLIADRVC
ncbi:nucleotide disphospho-sugar-binding domain-containing protein [Crossiella sp. NPDC003009]